MKGTLAAIGKVAGRGAAAFLRDGILEDLIIDPPDGRLRPGAIYRARVQRQLKGQGGCIVDTPHGPAFLRHAKGLFSGQLIMVQVVSFAEDHKAAPATTKIVLKSRYCLATPDAPGTNISRDIRNEERRVELRDLLKGIVPETIGVVVRSASEQADDQAVREDVSQTLELATKISGESLQGEPELLLDGPGAAHLAWREWARADTVDESEDAFERHGLPESLEAVSHPKVELSGAAHMFVEPTRALVAIDVNTGRDTSPASGLKANLAAAKVLPRALLTRGLGGQITIDFAPMPKRDRKTVEQALRSAFRRQPIETSLVGWTQLGHFELQRKRERLPLSLKLADKVI